MSKIEKKSPFQVENEGLKRWKAYLDEKYADIDIKLGSESAISKRFTEKIPIITCDDCCDFTEELTMGRAGRTNCDLCGKILDGYHWRWGDEKEKITNHKGKV